MESVSGLSCDTSMVTEILTKVEGLATSQTRLEVLLVAIRKELSSLAMHHKLGEVNDAHSWAESQDLCLPTEVATTLHGVEVDGGKAQVEAPTELADTRRFSDMNCEEVDGEVPPSLPSDWPASVNIRSDLTDAGVLRRLGPGSSYRKSLNIQTLSSATSEIMENVTSSKGFSRHIMVDPNSSFHTVYSVVSLFVLVHDLLVIPYMLAWDLPVEGFSLVTAWMSCCFWTLDVGLSCITGVSHAGHLEMRLYFVVRSYAKSWMLPDVVVVMGDWMSLLLAAASADAESSASIRTLRFAKAGKLIRLIGLLRMMRAVRIIEDFVDASLSDSARISLRCFLVVCGMLWVNHVVGCVWFALGRLAPSDTGMRWTDSSREWDGEQVRFMEYDLPHQYIASLHWSMAQFTLGAMDVEACNSIERIYTIVCMALGLIFGSTLVSTLSASMVDYQMTRNDQIQRLRKLRRFLRDNNISRAVAALVQQQAKERLSMQAKIQEEDVPALQLLSTALRTTLRYEMFKEHLYEHAFFRLWMAMDNLLVPELCMKALDSNMIRPHDDLFVPSGEADKAYTLISGDLVYTQEPMTAAVDHQMVVPVGPNRWFCEAALWTHWVHVGTAKARTPCQVLSISTSAMMELLTNHAKYHSVAEVAGEYCRVFHRRIVAARPPHASWPTDLEVPFTEYSDLVVGMVQEVQVTISQLALEQMQPRRHTVAEHSTLSNLSEEIRRGKSCLLVNADGDIERVASVVVVEIQNTCGQILVELGKREKCEPVNASCQLPGLKQEAGETLNSVLARLLSRLYLEVDDVEVVSVEREVEWKESKEYGVRTKYTRVIHHIDLHQDLPVPALAFSTGNRVTTTFSKASAMSTVSAASLGLMGRASRLTSYLSSWPSGPSAEFHGPVYMIESGSKNTFYTWLDPDEFERLKGPFGERELRHKLKYLDKQNLEDLTF